PDYDKYIGAALVDVPNPFRIVDKDEPSFGRYFEYEFMESVKPFGIQFDYKFQADLYRSGKYTNHIITALKKRFEIFDILAAHKTQESTAEDKAEYYPVQIYCPKCGRDTTKITKLSKDCKSAQYECKCGHAANFDFVKEHNCKLAWKIDWPMRWMYEGVDFEPGGKDHASINGSYDTSKHISREIYGYEPPYFQGYEFIGIKGLAGKMSGSSGLNLTPDTLLKIYQPELLLWLYAKNDPERAFDFCFDDGILNQYFEFDKMLNEVRQGTADEQKKSIIELCTIKGREVKTVPMSLLVQLGSIVDFNPKMLEVMFEKIGEKYKQKDFEERLLLAKHWLEVCNPESVTRLRPFRNFDYYQTLEDTEKKEIQELLAVLSKGKYDLDGLRDALYAIPKQVRNTTEVTPEVKKGQAKFFVNVYNLLIGKEKGPRLYLFLHALDKTKFLHLLDFSTPRREDEVEVVAQIQETKKERKALPDTIEPLKPQIQLDDFIKLDIRVCQITKCAEIRKSHSCYKITLDDGLQKDRTIVSSIKEHYTPEQLINKKILVICNLEPKRLAGVTSEGMLLANENGSCGCKVVFVDDSIPCGTRLK
ncbi:MAG: lysine--tRNA ligase, partial [Firmicutes bacterium]|nr:lysine--tRNA ligase [Bacillota bacterium]